MMTGWSQTIQIMTRSAAGGLMIVLIAVGVMNVAVMAALAVVIFAEKLWRHGKPFGQAVGVLLAAIPGGLASLLLQGAEEFPAGLLAAPAGVGADPAVRMVLGVPLALVAAALADGHAGLQQRLGHIGVVRRRAADDPGDGGADIGAVQAQPDALDHLGQVVLAQVSVDVSGTGLDTVADRVDGAGQHVGVNVDGAREGA
jgi:hypothetical protein